MVLTTVLLLSMMGDVAHDRDVRAAMWDLIAQTRYGFSETEEAMFIVRSGSGYAFVRWPPAGMAHQARWTQRFPRGVVAIVHTHPNWIPHPSEIDVRTARRTSVPVYVVTRTKITRTTGDDVTTVVMGDWKP